MLCSFVQVNDREKGEIMDNGLVKGHGYGVTDVKSIKLAKTLQKQLGSSTIQLVRLRNPWGTKEWNGCWSDEYVNFSGKICDSHWNQTFLALCCVNSMNI